MILERLRTETKSAHQALEKLIIPKIKGIRSKEDYIKLLQLFYGYFQPMEQVLDKHLNDSTVPEYSNRRKADAIENDIKLAEGSIPAQTAGDLPSISNASEAMGAMYVLEGSTQGGKIISKMIMQGLQMQSDEGVSFFKGYGDDSDRMWGAFTDKLDNFTDDPAQLDQIAKAANDTFVKFRTWVLQNEPVAANN